MDEARKKTLAVCAAFIAAPRLLFLDEESPAALRDALSDAIRKAEILLSQVDSRWPINRIPGKS
jgi:ABC-type branched-subunit amino acid transport system ATPase component